MTDNPVHPLTDKALEKLRALVEGNGIPADKIELLGTEEKILTLQAEMHLALGMATQRQRYAGMPPVPQKQEVEVKVLPFAQDIPKQVEEFKSELEGSTRWLEEVVEQLKAAPGQGFGIMRSDITLESMARIFRAHENCSTCGGAGSKMCDSCRGTGQVPCQHCLGSGFEVCQQCGGRGTDPNDPQRYCPACNGSTQAQCRYCYGRRYMACPTCNGKQQITCQACSGHGKFTLEERALPTVQGDLKIMDATDLPSGLRRVFDRGGLKILARGQAQIVMEPAREREGGTKIIPYSATFPYADMRLRINGKPMKAMAIGEKASIRDMPPFLDVVFEEELAKIGGKSGGSASLERALKLRAMRDLFGLMQQGGEVELPFRRLYPVGISPTMISRMRAVLDKVVQERTLLVRAGASVFVFLLLGGLFSGLITGGVRNQIAHAFFPAAAYFFDALVCGLSFLLVDVALRFSSAVYLRQLTRSNEKVSFHAQRSGSLGIAVGVCIALVYVGLLWFLKATPGFFG